MTEKVESLGKAVESRHWEERKSQIDPYFEILQEVMGENLLGKKLLDVGCAAGVEAEAFTQKGFVVAGVDKNENFIKEAKQKLPKSEFVVGSAEELPFAESSFDIVFSINTLFYTDIEKSIPEFLRVLNSDGCCIFSFDTKIVNLDKGKVFHNETMEHLREVVEGCGAHIEYEGEEEKRIDETPFRHQHTFEKMVLRKGV